MAGQILLLDHVGLYTAPEDGTLFLRIHDDDRCLVDNDGLLTLRVTPSERPLEVTKTAVSESAVIGEKVLYTLVVINSGNADATNVTLEDKLPAELWPFIALSPKTNPPESILSTQ